MAQSLVNVRDYAYCRSAKAINTGKDAIDKLTGRLRLAALHGAYTVVRDPAPEECPQNAGETSWQGWSAWANALYKQVSGE